MIECNCCGHEFDPEECDLEPDAEYCPDCLEYCVYE